MKKTKKQEISNSIEHLEMEDVVVIKQAMQNVFGGIDLDGLKILPKDQKPPCACSITVNTYACDNAS
jgi:hypothetical protein